MKRDFFDYMLKVMDENPDVYLIFVGLGYPRLEEFVSKFPQRTLNTEAAEQSALDIAVGLAYSGKIPFVYTITPFLLRGWETIRTYINHENLHCILIGAGRDDEYSKHDGFSHEAEDVSQHFDLMDNFEQYYPDDKKALEKAINLSLRVDKPSFINIHK